MAIDSPISKKGYALLKIFIIHFLFLNTVDGNVCFQRVYQSMSIIAYRTTSQTITYRCGWLFRWSRCRRIVYLQASMMHYVSTSQPTCCEGYMLTTDEDGCLPVCQGQCEYPMICVAPNTCECPGGYRGTDCNYPLCENCSHPHQVCVAPNRCECRNGFNGTNCSSDVDECQISNGGCDHFCNNTNGSYMCGCQQQFLLSDDQRSCIGPLNITWNILNNGTLSLLWKRPIWDTRNITRGVRVNCNNSNHIILEDRSISDAMIILAGLNLNGTVTCCHMLIISMNEIGPQKCEEYSQRSVVEDSTTESSQSAMTGEYLTISKHTATPASSINTDAVIAGASGAVIVLLLLLVFVIVAVLIAYGVQKRKKCARDDPAGISYHHSMQNEEVYNVTFRQGVDNNCQGGVDNPNYASPEVDLQYDILRFEANTRNEANMQDITKDYEPEYSHLKH